jgi:U3 small nucleolar RNA-associated protein 11
MSALRNAVKRKTHKERSQPAERRKFGLLEKKKDYVLRARDFHKKEDAIKVLKTKAGNRNPDEFYFGMERSKTVGGVHQGRADESNKYTADELALMKTQDVKYVSLKASIETKAAAKLRANLHNVGLDADEYFLSSEEEEDEEYDEDGYLVRKAPVTKKKRKHTLFVEDRETARRHKRSVETDKSVEKKNATDATRQKASAVAARALGVRAHLTRAVEREERDDAGIGVATTLDPKVLKRLEKKKKVAYQLLREQSSRAARLKNMASEMVMRREISHSKGHKRKMGGSGNDEDVPEGLKHLQKKQAQFKWKKERKR